MHWNNWDNIVLWIMKDHIPESMLDQGKLLMVKHQSEGEKQRENMAKATEQKHRNYLQRILYIFSDCLDFWMVLLQH